jgi:hypothetical protein
VLYEIVAVKVRSNYRLWVRFSDGSEGEIDLSSLVGNGVFARWEDPMEFDKVYIDPETRTVAWPGDIDLAPDAIYRDIANEAAA